MCHERERVIGYVYGECDPAERREVDAHLAECSECREEVGALRQVRQDLLAWEVPEHGSVWRPFAPSRPRLSWRDVPAWAMAAAAGAIFFVGAAGGVATRAVWPASTHVPTMATVPQPTAAPVLTTADLAALEARITARVRTELESRQVAAQPAAARDVDLKQMGARLARFEKEYADWKDAQVDVNASFLRDIQGLKNPRFASVSNRPDLSRMQPASLVR